MKKKMVLILIGFSLYASASEYYYERGKKIELTELSQKKANSNNHVKYYLTKTGNKIGVTNELIVQCKADIDCIEVLKEYAFEQVSELSKISLVKEVSKLSETLFLVKIKKDENIFKVSKTLYNNKAIILAHPNFIKSIR